MFMAEIPFIAFWVLLAFGWYLEEVNLKMAAAFIAVFVVASFGISILSENGAWHVALVVLLDIILLLKVFGGDVRLR